jgi:ferredoxin-NADP reductase
MPIETEATVSEVIVRTPSVKSIRVIPRETADFLAGQWLMVTLPQSPNLKKPLSISNSPTEGGHLELTKKITSSEFSAAFSALKPGDRVRLRYPCGCFVFPCDMPKIAFLSGGIGITPIRSICRCLTDRGAETDAVLLYGNNSIDEIAFRDDLDAMCSRNPKLKVVHILREAPKDWKGHTGLITESIVRSEIPDYRERRFYLCGPPVMVESIQKILLGPLAVPRERIVTENFTGYN